MPPIAIAGPLATTRSIGSLNAGSSTDVLVIRHGANRVRVQAPDAGLRIGIIAPSTPGDPLAVGEYVEVSAGEWFDLAFHAGDLGSYTLAPGAIPIFRFFVETLGSSFVHVAVMKADHAQLGRAGPALLPAPVGSGGLMLRGEIDFTSLTPTDITTTGITTVDGIDFDVDTLAAGSTIRIDATGIKIVGGTGSVGLNIDLATVNGGLDMSGDELWGWTLATNDTGKWGVYMGQSLNDRFGVIRTTITNMDNQVRRGGVLAFFPHSVSEAVQNVWASISPGATAVSRYDTPAPAGAISPTAVSTVGVSAATNGPGWKPHTASGGIGRLFWTDASARSALHTNFSFWSGT